MDHHWLRQRAGQRRAEAEAAGRRGQGREGSAERSAEVKSTANHRHWRNKFHCGSPSLLHSRVRSSLVTILQSTLQPQETTTAGVVIRSRKVQNPNVVLHDGKALHTFPTNLPTYLIRSPARIGSRYAADLLDRTSNKQPSDHRRISFKSPDLHLTTFARTPRDGFTTRSRDGRRV